MLYYYRVIQALSPTILPLEVLAPSRNINSKPIDRLRTAIIYDLQFFKKNALLSCEVGQGCKMRTVENTTAYPLTNFRHNIYPLGSSWATLYLNPLHGWIDPSLYIRVRPDGATPTSHPQVVGTRSVHEE